MNKFFVAGLTMLAMTASAVAQAPPKPAYLVAEYTVTDDSAFKAWGEKSAALAKAHGGEFLVRGGHPAIAAGEAPSRATIIRFESMEKARSYFELPENKALAAERDKAAKFRSYLLE